VLAAIKARTTEGSARRVDHVDRRLSTSTSFTPPPAMPRFPTLAELDSVSPNQPVYIQMSFSGPSVTNSLGKAFFASKGIEVGAEGSLAARLPNAEPDHQGALRAAPAADTRRPEARHARRDALRSTVGITTHLDQGGFPSAHDDTDGRRALRRVPRVRRAARAVSRRRAHHSLQESTSSTWRPDEGTPHLKAPPGQCLSESTAPTC